MSGKTSILLRDGDDTAALAEVTRLAGHALPGRRRRLRETKTQTASMQTALTEPVRTPSLQRSRRARCPREARRCRS